MTMFFSTTPNPSSQEEGTTGSEIAPKTSIKPSSLNYKRHNYYIWTVLFTQQDA